MQLNYDLKAGGALVFTANQQTAENGQNDKTRVSRHMMSKLDISDDLLSNVSSRQAGGPGEQKLHRCFAVFCFDSATSHFQSRLLFVSFVTISNLQFLLFVETSNCH